MGKLTAVALVFVLQGGPAEADRLEQQAGSSLQADPGAAVSLLRRAVAIRERQQPPDDPALGRTLNHLSYALSLSGDHADALAVGQRALATVKSVGDATPMTAAIYRNLAEVAERGARLDLAREYADQAVADMEASYGKTPTSAEFREYAATVAMRLGDSDAAIDHLVWALAIYERMFRQTNPEKLAGPLRGLAGVFAGEGWFDAALDLHNRSLEMLQRSGKTGTPLWLGHLGSRQALQQELGEFRCARDDFRLLTGALAGVLPPEQLVPSRLEWAGRWLALGNEARARESLRELPTEGLPPGADAQRLLMEGRSELLAGRFQQALAKAEAARGAFAETAPGDSSPVVVELAWLEARALCGLGEPARAFDGLMELFRIERETWGEDASRLTPTFLEMLAAEIPAHGVSPELIDLIDFVEASSALALPSTLASLQNRSWLNDRRSAWDPLERAWLHAARQKSERLPACFQALDRCRERARLAVYAWWLERGAAQRSDQLSNLLDVLRREAEGSTAKEARAQLRAEFRDRLQSFRASDSPWKAMVAPDGVELESARAALSDGEALLIYCWAEPEVWAVLVSVDPEHDLAVELGSAADVRAALDGATRTLSDPSRPCDLAPLSRMLLKPLWEHLQGLSSVVVLADGPMAFVPFEALPTPENELWVRSCRVVYAPTLRTWVELPTDPVDGDAVAAHLFQAAASEEGEPGGDQLRRLLTRIPEDDRPQPPTPEVVPGLPEDDVVMGSELALKAADREGRLRDVSVLDVRAPAYVDAEVPSASAIVTRPGKQGEELSAWEREDGVVSLLELRDLTLSARTVVLWRAQVIPRRGVRRAEGPQELVASLCAAGARGVLLSSWMPAGGVSERFDDAVRDALRGGDPARALVDVQRQWLSRHGDDPTLGHPAIWARLRYFGR